MKALKVERFLAALSASDFLLFAKLDVLMRVASRVTACNDPDETEPPIEGAEKYYQRCQQILMLLSNLGIFWDIFAILICPICHSECRGPRSPHFPKIEWHVYRKKMLFLEQYAIEECSIASYIAYHKCTMQTRRKYRR